MQREIRWDDRKNAQLKRMRGVSFDELLRAALVAEIENPARGGQRILLFERDGYIWVVPFVERAGQMFLKTLYPSRKFTKKWRRGDLR